MGGRSTARGGAGAFFAPAVSLVAALAAAHAANAQATQAGSTPATSLAPATPVTSPAPYAPATDVLVRGARAARRDLDQTITAAQSRATPGTHDDPIAAVQDLPGLSRPAFDSGQLVVWGASPQDTQTFVDGVPIPQLFHGSGLRSVVNGALVRSVTLTPGGYGSDYGRSLGAVVRVDTADLQATGVHATASADTLDGSVFASAALTPSVRLGAAARVGWIAPLFEAVEGSGASGIGDFVAVPRYRDYQSKAQIALREGESLDVVLLGSGDDETRSIPDADPARARSQTTSSAFQRLYLHYRRALSDGDLVDVVPWVGHDASTLDDRFGFVPADVDQSTWRWGLRASRRSRPAKQVALTWGLDVDGSHANVSRSGSLEIPPREGDIAVFGQPPGSGEAADAWTADIVGLAPYLTADVELGPLVLTPGLRFDAYLLQASRQTPRVGQTPSIGLSHVDALLEPVLAARLHVASRWDLVASAGLYSQPPAAADLSAVFGAPTLGPEAAAVVTAGETVRLAPQLTAEMLGFYKALSDLAVRDPSPTPRLAHALLDDGIGRAYGVEWLVRQAPWRGFSGWIAYTISRSERRDAPGLGWRLFDYDQPHVLAVVAGKTLGPWSVGLRLRYARGLPRTPVTGAIFDASDDVFQPVFGAQSSIRLPDFWQLDLRVDRSFAPAPDVRVVVYAEGLNVTDHTNGEEFIYNADYTRRGLVTGLPTLAVVGARVEL